MNDTLRIMNKEKMKCIFVHFSHDKLHVKHMHFCDLKWPTNELKESFGVHYSLVVGQVCLHRCHISKQLRLIIISMNDFCLLCPAIHFSNKATSLLTQTGRALTFCKQSLTVHCRILATTFSLCYIQDRQWRFGQKNLIFTLWWELQNFLRIVGN